MTDKSSFTVTTTEDSGAGSLRWAIEQANAAGSATIAFSIGFGPVTIRPNGPLPPLAFSGSVDGSTQPGYSGKPIVALCGSEFPGVSLPAAISPFAFMTGGMEIVGNGLTIKDLVVTSFPSTGLYACGVHDLAIQACHIGIDGDTAAGNGQVGIAVTQSRNVSVGGAGQPVVVSGNALHGILANLVEGLSVSNVRVGTNVDGTAVVANGGSGLKTWDCAGLTIGGAAQVSVFSGNALYGVEVAGAGTSGATVTGCRIGTDLAGIIGIPNGRTGLLVYSAAHARIGGSASGEMNVISCNARAGINLDGSVAAGGDPSGTGGTGLTHDTLVIGNHIGTDVTGEVALPNALRGLLICYSQAGVIERNVISGNGGDGILVLGPSVAQSDPALVPRDNRIIANRIGISASGMRLANARHGIYVQHGSCNRVGSDDPADANVIAHNGKRGVTFRGTGWDTNVLGENRIADNGLGAFYQAP